MKSERVVLEMHGRNTPRKGMILAAGLGTRMRPITDRIPKPLVEVHGKTLLDHALDALKRAGVTEAVVNVHHHADQIIGHVEHRTDLQITISDEREELLDSAGGIINALPHLGVEPFYLLNADSFWIEGFKPNLVRLAESWNASNMDMLLLLAGTCSAIGFASKGDFNMDAEGHLERRMENRIAPFAYAGGAIISPSVFKGTEPGPSSLNAQFDTAIDKQRLFGMRLEGLWLHVGTPEAIIQAEEAIAKSAA